MGTYPNPFSFMGKKTEGIWSGDILTFVDLVEP